MKKTLKAVSGSFPNAPSTRKPVISMARAASGEETMRMILEARGRRSRRSAQPLGSNSRMFHTRGRRRLKPARHPLPDRLARQLRAWHRDRQTPGCHHGQTITNRK